jgi:uncharacterized membrane protein (UPF0127 family)
MWRWLLVMLLVAAACAGSSSTDPMPSTEPIEQNAASSSNASDDITTAPIGPARDAVPPVGFDLVAARVTEPDGTVCEPCLWLASSAEQRNRGLMGVTGLEPADGMAFRYPAPHSTRFWMKDTLLAVSIAFYGPDGAFMDSFDMEPCVTASCVRYPTPTDFLIAVETYRGGLDGLGMRAGSTLELLDVPCELGDVPGA